jgi:D-tyrosyl-tRNA(Tyr) deacylase
MKVIVQRVLDTTLSVDDKEYSHIDKGLLVYVGFNINDTIDSIPYMVNKVSGLRIFEDDAGKMNLSVSDIGGSIMIVSNFTLYADCSHGFRPAFVNAMGGESAVKLYDTFVNQMKERLPGKIATGEFGADMKIDSICDGPINVIIEK